MDIKQELQQLPTTHCTLLYLVSNNRILLVRKTRGFGAGTLDGVGGKIESGESSSEAAVREAKEEIGVTPSLFTKVADLHYLELFDGKEPAHVHIDAYICEEWSGEPRATEEASDPKWYACDAIPYETMLPDLPYWLPQALAGDKVVGRFTLDADNQLTAHKVEIVEAFPGL